MKLLLVVVGLFMIASSMARQKVTCTTRKNVFVIDRDQPDFDPPSIEYCVFEGNFVFYSGKNYMVCFLNYYIIAKFYCS